MNTLRSSSDFPALDAVGTMTTRKGEDPTPVFVIGRYTALRCFEVQETARRGDPIHLFTSYLFRQDKWGMWREVESSQNSEAYVFVKGGRVLKF